MWLLDVLVILAVVLVAILCFAPPLWPASDTGIAAAARAYILPSLIHHARILPRDAAHAFRYPTLHLAVRLDELESGALDCSLSKWTPFFAVFAWKGPGSDGTRAMTAMHPDGYGRRAFPEVDDAQQQARIGGSIYRKLIYELQTRGFLSSASLQSPEEEEKVGHVWAVTMPSLLGMGGFNPLTVYYVHRPHASDAQLRGPLWLAVLEVHNTFAERHIYVCEVGQHEDEDGRKGYEYAWTFPRAFHVSPFNDRAGYYRLLLRDLWASAESTVPTLDVKLLLLVEEEEEEEAAVTDGEDTPLSSSSYDLVEDEFTVKTTTTAPKKAKKLQKKLMASLASAATDTGNGSCKPTSTLRPTRRPVPLTSANMLLALAYQPFDLVLPTMRIMVEAAKLHWRKRLPVYMRPEPEDGGAVRRAGGSSSGIGWPLDSNPIEVDRRQAAEERIEEESAAMRPRRSGTTLWAEQGWMEAAARSRILDYAKWKTVQSGFVLRILTKDPETPNTVVEDGEVSTLPAGIASPPLEDEKKRDGKRVLTIYSTSPAFFTDLGLYTSADLAFLFGARAARRWGVSDVDDYRAFFSGFPPATDGQKATLAYRLVAWVREIHLRWCLSLPGDTGEVLRRSLDEQQGAIDDVVPPTRAFVATLLVAHLSLRALVTFSNLLHVRYVRQPWAEVQEGLNILRDDDAKQKK